MIARLIRRLRAEEGASMIEFSLVSVLLVITLLSVVEVARMVLVYTTIADAASAGTRYAIVNGSDQTSTESGPGGASSPYTCTCTAVQTVVKNYAAAGMGSINTSNLTITVAYPDSGGNGPGQHVLVTVQYTYQPLIGYFNRLLNTTLGSQSEGVITY